jgi:hypothetical protein
MFVRADALLPTMGPVERLTDVSAAFEKSTLRVRHAGLMVATGR